MTTEYQWATEQFRAGQRDARKLAATYGKGAAKPNHWVTTKAAAGDEYAKGWLYEWGQYIQFQPEQVSG